MKHEIPKKVFSWFLVILVFAASFLSPLTVMASINANNLQEAAYVRYLVKIADACLSDVQNSDVVILDTDSNSESRKKLSSFYNLNFDYGTTTLYDSYIESLGQGGYENGNVWCQEVRQRINVVPDLLSKFNLYNSTELPNIICGKNGSDGLFKIKMGNIIGYGGSEKIYEKDREYWPDNSALSADSDGYATDCRAAFNLIRYYAEENVNGVISRPDQTGGQTKRPFGVQFIVNKNFNFHNYLNEYLEEYDFSYDDLYLANKYLNFTK